MNPTNYCGQFARLLICYMSFVWNMPGRVCEMISSLTNHVKEPLQCWLKIKILSGKISSNIGRIVTAFRRFEGETWFNINTILTCNIGNCCHEIFQLYHKLVRHITCDRTHNDATIGLVCCLDILDDISPTIRHGKYIDCVNYQWV